jgi:hypothetical protein
MGFYEMAIKRTPGNQKQGYRNIEQIDLATGMQQVIAGTWEGIGLLETLDGHTHIFGRQVLIVADGIDRHRLREKFPGVMIFTSVEFLDVISDWPETEGVILAKRIFNGEITKGVKK